MVSSIATANYVLANDGGESDWDADQALAATPDGCISVTLSTGLMQVLAWHCNYGRGRSAQSLAGLAGALNRKWNPSVLVSFESGLRVPGCASLITEMRYDGARVSLWGNQVRLEVDPRVYNKVLAYYHLIRERRIKGAMATGSSDLRDDRSAYYMLWFGKKPWSE